MAKIKCFDKFGKEYEFEKSQCIYRRSVYGLFIKDNQVLMVKDKVSKRWELPGGGLEGGEEDMEALKREFFEETGFNIDTKNSKLIHNQKGYYYSLGEDVAWNSDRFYFTVEVIDGKNLENGNGIDILAAKFIDLSELSKYNTAETDLKAINFLIRG